MTAALPVVAEVVRSGFVEARHTGSVLAVTADGATVLAVGDVAAPVFPRSCLKPLQAVGMLRAGLDIDDTGLALVAASHSGEDHHVAIARGILAAAGLDESALANTPSMPLDDEAARAVVIAGGGPDRLRQNCSGKHAGMLATCVTAGWPIAGYTDPEHPLQVAISAAVTDLSGEQPAAVGIDGCGAPVFAISLTAVGHAFSRLVTAQRGTPERRVADAMRAHPDVVGGRGRDVTKLMAAIPGLLAKDGCTRRWSRRGREDR